MKCKGDKMLCTGRQVGKTECCAKDCHDWATTTTKKGIILMTAPQEFQAEILFVKTLNYFEQFSPNEIKRGKDRPTKTKIMLKKGITIICKTAGTTGFGLRGLTVIRIYVDECAQMTEMSWESIDPQTLTTGADTIYLSTPFGMQGRFYECWINKNNAYNSFSRFGIDSETCIKNRKITERWTLQVREKALEKIESARNRLTHKQFMQEYMGQFIESLMQWFPDQLIKKCSTAKPTEYHPKYKYYLGVDVGGKGGSESTFQIVRKDQNNKNKIIHVKSIVEDFEKTTDTERLIIHLDGQFHFKKIYIDDGGIGTGVYDHLLEHPKIKRRIEAINNSKRNLIPETEEHPRRTSLMKNDLYNNLLGMMERGEIIIIDDPKVFQSLKSVQFEITENKKLIIFGNYTHIVEGLIRAAWCIKDKSLNLWVR